MGEGQDGGEDTLSPDLSKYKPVGIRLSENLKLTIAIDIYAI